MQLFKFFHTENPSKQQKNGESLKKERGEQPSVTLIQILIHVQIIEPSANHPT